MKLNLKIILITAVLLLASFAKTASAQDYAEIKDKIMKVYDIFNSGNFTGLDKYIDAGLIEHSPMPGQAPGLDGLIAAMKDFRKAYPDLQFTVNDVIIADNKAAVLNTITGTNDGDFMGMPATHKKINVMGIDWLMIKDGKCIEHWGYSEEMKMMQQLGLMK